MIEEPSEEFYRAFRSNHGSIIMDCQCGRVHFNYMDSFCFESGELEELERKQQEKPDKYFAHDYTITSYIISGHEFVIGCPCNYGRKYEDFINDNAIAIAEYLNEKAEQYRKYADKIECKDSV